MQRRKPKLAAPTASTSASQLQLFAVVAPGLEEVTAAELKALPGLSAITTTVGGVEFCGDLAALYRANLHLRTASRVLLRLATLRAVHFPELRTQVTQLPWRRFAHGPVRVTLAVTARHCRLYHSGAIAERVLAGMQDAGVVVLEPQADGASDAPELHLVIRGEQDLFTISLDTSGELLHKRGYRSEDTGAPLRETLAAGLCHLAGYCGGAVTPQALPEPLFDPMCGSGTLVIEAALWAMRRAPGRDREFAFMRWPDFQAPLWQTTYAQAVAAERPLPTGLFFASDLSPEAIATARRNAERAGVLAAIHFHCGDVRTATLPPQPSGLVLCNPPYGVRLTDPRLHRLYQALGKLLRGRPQWRLAVFTSARQLAAALPQPLLEIPIRNGGLRTALYLSQTAPLQPARPPELSA